MANMVDLISQQAVQENTKSPLDGVAEGVKTGIGLYQAKQQIELQKKQNEEAKMALDDKKFKAIGNRLRAAAFSTDKKIFDSRLQGAKLYADQANVPLNDQAIRDIYSNEQTRLVFQKGINDIMSGKVPVNQEEFLATLGDNQALYDWAEAGIFANTASQSKLDLEQAKLDSKLEGLKAGQELKRDKQDATLAKQDKDFVNKFIDTFNANPQVRKFEDRLSAADSADELLRVNNPITGEAAKTAVARLSGEVGALTEQDTARFGGSKALLSRLETIGTQAASGKLTPENKKYLQEVVDAYRKSITKSRSDFAKKYVKQKANAGLVDEAVAIEWVNPKMEAVAVLETEKTPAASFDKEAFIKKQLAKGNSMEKINAYLNSKGIK